MAARIDYIEPSSEAAKYKPWYRNYVLAILFIAYVINALDRGIIATLLEPIRHEFNATDTQLGLLSGIAFALFYAVMGIPIAALADRSVRKNVLGFAIFFWSGMTALCGMAANFTLLLLARIGTAVGEAGGTPPSHSLIADYFPLSKRATALSVYATGIPVGMMLGSLLGGHGSDLFGWRLTFIIAGIPGLLLAPVIFLTIKEPPRGMSDAISNRTRESAPSIFTVFKYLWQRKAFRFMSMACAFHAFVSYGVGSFNPAFLMRSHEFTAGQAGNLAALMLGFGIIGTFFGGFLADRISSRASDSRWYVWLPGICVLGAVPFQLIAYLSPSIMLIVPAFIIAGILGASYYGPAFAMTQALASIRMRAVAASVFLFIQTLIGLGLGPVFAGVVSDQLYDFAGEDSLRYSLVIVAMFNVVSAIFYYFSARSLREDLETTRRYDAAETV
jgi:MFS family permease